MSALVSYTFRYLPLCVMLLLCPLVVLLRCVRSFITLCLPELNIYIMPVSFYGGYCCLHMCPLYHMMLIHVISCCLQLAFLLLWVVWMWNSSMYHCTGNAGGDWYNTMDCGGSFSSSTLIWCTLPCPFLTALCCETQMIRLLDLWGSCKYMYNQYFVRTAERKFEGFIPQTRKPREKKNSCTKTWLAHYTLKSWIAVLCCTFSLALPQLL